MAATTVAATNRRAVTLLRTARRRVHTVTRFSFATPHHSWERGTNENTNGLIRQYLPNGQRMGTRTQQDCHAIARRLNTRPRKRLGSRTPEEGSAR